ncbi:putative efflux protein, MATE family [Anaerosporobacter mobilis DSM 15930]|uniref:Multidrug export protein MepA n=1 Tax=Anaerosporobacter mobilis DSM 15930 TaxID=1120996 RepID=A0A1M7M615_9FIRM|nr:MATE family efflux transporter [Anaerosporobacter mobilis]SHM86172.1 putative efflux protein, MATE family [Anaerosporobacter mobilis DSM 15930]
MDTKSDNKLGTEKIGKLVFSLALPAVIAQMVNVLYNIVDRMYIGHIPKIGSTALTGLGVCFPILMLISAFSAFVGSGGAPLASIQLGKGNKKEAEKILGNGVTMLLAFSLILTFGFMIFKEPLLYAFGASDKTFTYANQYLTIYLLGTIFVQAAIGLNTFITCQGQAKVAMFSVLIGAIINIVLDPIFIFVFDLGVRGAALATIISQGCSAIWVVAFLVSKRSSLRIKLSNLKPNWKIIGAIAALGVSPFIMQATESLINIVFNSGLKHYGGDVYVGSMTILQSVMQLFVLPTQGITMGTQPIISYNYGAKNHQRVKDAFKYTLIVTVIITIMATISVALFPQVFARMFTSDQELIALVVKVLPIFMAGIWIFGVQMACQSAFMGMGQAKISLFLALLRKVILLIPLAIILPRFTGVMGIYYAEPIADILAAITTGTLFALSFKKILAKA